MLHKTYKNTPTDNLHKMYYLTNISCTVETQTMKMVMVFRGRSQSDLHDKFKKKKSIQYEQKPKHYNKMHITVLYIRS